MTYIFFSEMRSTTSLPRNRERREIRVSDEGRDNETRKNYLFLYAIISKKNWMVFIYMRRQMKKAFKEEIVIYGVKIFLSFNRVN